MRVRRIAAVSLSILAVSSVPAIGSEKPTVTPYKRPGLNQLVSLTSSGGQTDGNSADSHVSVDGRFVTFFSDATNLVPDDTNEQGDVFVRDTVAGTTQRASVANNGEQSNGMSMNPDISADGRYITFVSYATNLTDEVDTTNTNTEVYVRDLLEGTTQRVTHAVTGGPSEGGSLQPTISADGRYVAFFSHATDLIPNDTNAKGDVFVFDRQSSEMKVTSVAPNGTLGNGLSSFAEISDDGSTIAFRSGATNLVADDSNGYPDVFVRDIASGATELVSISSDGTQGNGDAFSPIIGISADGRYISFQSSASNLVPNDTNGLADPMFGSDVFVRDRETDKTERVSLTSDGTEFVDAFAGTLSADGRYVAFHATRTGQSSSDFGAWADVYVHDRVTDSTELSSATSKFSDYLVGDSENAVITGDGRYVYFQTLAPNFVPGDGNEYMDIVRRVRGSNRGLLSIKVDKFTDGSRLSGVATFGGEVLSSATDATDPGIGSIGADITSASTTYRHEDGDILFRIGLDSIPSLTAGNAAATGTGSAGGVPALVYGFSFTLNGERWEIRGATASASEASTPAFARYYCEPVCLPGAIAIPGGFGTAGPEIQISLPAPLMGLQPGEKLEAIRGFVGPGEMATGALASLDEITLGDVTIPDAQVFLGRGSEDSAAFEIGASSFSGAFAELLQGAIPENGAFWAKACLDDRCGEPEKIN